MHGAICERIHLEVIDMYPNFTYGLNGHEVSNIEEARAAQIIPNGMIYYFPSMAEGRIYAKTTDMNGGLIFNVYELREQKKPVTIEQLEKKIDRLEKMVEEMKKGDDFDVSTVK
jgi:hypothetical protein